MRLRINGFRPEQFGFNPRICKRCDSGIATFSYPPDVSIHASVKDATIFSRHSSYFYKVSIHASVKDATCVWIGSSCKRCFNPRICKRCDIYGDKFIYWCSGFNPRICKRCDVRDHVSDICALSFNPRICKRCDPGAHRP